MMRYSETGFQPMIKNIKPVESLTVDDFKADPMWEYLNAASTTCVELLLWKSDSLISLVLPGEYVRDARRQ
jgi:hypothetical protein